jgi:hypothetical protein
MNTYANGRIDIKSPNTQQLFSMYDRIPAHQCTSYRDPTEGMWDNTVLSEHYFSKENIQILQNAIRAGIYKKSKGQYLIPPQQCDILKIIMRSVYLQHSASRPTHIREQIEELNKIVLNYSIQQVYGEIQGYLKYIDDASTLVVPIQHPVMADNTDRELYFSGWF